MSLKRNQLPPISGKVSSGKAENLSLNLNDRLFSVRSTNKTQLGESPLWVERLNSVLYVDILGNCIYQYHLHNQTNHRYAMPQPVCWLVLDIDQNIIAGMQDGIWQLDDCFKPTRLISKLPALPECARLNDAKVDKLGRLWFGTMDKQVNRPVGQLFCLDKGVLTEVDQDYWVTNGPAFNQDNSVMYHNDTELRQINAYSLQKDKVDGKTPFIQFDDIFEDDQGCPDGMVVDSQNNIWVAHWQGGRISQFSSTGHCLQQIILPTSCITSLTFAGHKLSRLFVTSAQEEGGNKENQKNTVSHAGCLFEVFTDSFGEAQGLYRY